MKDLLAFALFLALLTLAELADNYLDRMKIENCLRSPGAKWIHRPGCDPDYCKDPQ